MNLNRDWPSVTVEEIQAPHPYALATGPFGSSISARYFVQSGVPVIRGSNLSDDSEVRLNDEGLVFISTEMAKEFARSIARRGDLVFTCWGTIGQVGLIDERSSYGEYVVSNKQMKFTPDPRRANSLFLYYLFSGPELSRKIRDSAIGSSVPGFNLGQLRALKFALPPIAEQQAIAAALGDADAYIDALAQRIAKQRLVKQGAMQELLRPKATDEVRNLADVSTLKGRIGWQGLKQTEFTTNSNEPFLITGMNFKDGAIRWAEVYHISEERYEMAKDIQLRTGDVLMTKDGTIGKVLYIDEIPPPEKASLNSHLLLFRPVADNYHPKYLYYQLNSKRFKDFIELSKSGSTFFGISQAAVGMYPVLLPPVTDQLAIAAVLGDMDAAIEALEAKLAKARLVKQGMMQELLTGRVRLV